MDINRRMFHIYQAVEQCGRDIWFVDIEEEDGSDTIDAIRVNLPKSERYSDEDTLFTTITPGIFSDDVFTADNTLSGEGERVVSSYIVERYVEKLSSMTFPCGLTTISSLNEFIIQSGSLPDSWTIVELAWRLLDEAIESKKTSNRNTEVELFSNNEIARMSGQIEALRKLTPDEREKVCWKARRTSSAIELVAEQF